MTQPLKMISVRHTWAHLIVHGNADGIVKDIENRSWKTHYRGPLLIHASLKRSPASPALGTTPLQYGGIIGIVRLVDCVTQSKSRWFEGKFGFVLKDPMPLPFVKWKGALSLLDAPKELVQRLDQRKLREYLSP